MTYYQLLEVSPTATTEQIRMAYRKKAFELHPDRNKSPNANQQFIAVRLAYEILSDSKKRTKYDASLRINEFALITDQQSSVPSGHDEKMRDLYEEIEYLKHIHYDPIEEWVKLYRMSWKEWSTIPKEIKLKKIGAELIFRLCYAAFGAAIVILVFLFISPGGLWGGIGVITKIYDHPILRSKLLMGILVFVVTFFVFAKGIGQLYRMLKRDD